MGGLTCSSCAIVVRTALASVDHVLEAVVSFLPPTAAVAAQQPLDFLALSGPLFSTPLLPLRSLVSWCLTNFWLQRLWNGSATSSTQGVRPVATLRCPAQKARRLLSMEQVYPFPALQSFLADASQTSARPPSRSEA